MSIYATKKELNNATDIDKFNLTDKKDFVALEAGMDKIDGTGLVTATVLNTKISWVDNKIQNYCCF